MEPWAGKSGLSNVALSATLLIAPLSPCGVRVRVRRISVCSFSQQAWLDLCRGHEGLDHNFYVADFVFYLQSTGCLLS